MMRHHGGFSIRKVTSAGLAGLLVSSAPAVTIGVGLLSATALTPAFAQDLTTGEMVGTVKDGSGATVSGVTVTLTDASRGFTATSISGSDGRWRFARLQIATYTASISYNGKTQSEVIRVQAGSVRGVDFVVNTGSEDAIIVTAQRTTSTTKDYLGQEGGIVVDMDDLIERVPVPRDITAVTLLAPGTTQGEGDFGNLPSIAGSSVSENTIYVDGFNVTDPRRLLGLMNTVPFEFFQQQDVKTGGFQAEFGRSTGGVINLVTRRGTNEFHGGINVFAEPSETRNKLPDTTDIFRSLDKVSRYEANIWLSGPIIKDRLFFYGLLGLRNNESRDFTNSSFNFTDQDDPRWGLKLDAVLWDDEVLGRHTLGYTHIDDSAVNTTQSFAFDRAVFEANGGLPPNIGNQFGTSFNKAGGQTDIFKYTGVIRDWLTISGLYGVSDNNVTSLSDKDGNPAIGDNRVSATNPSGSFQRLGDFVNFSVRPIDSNKRELYRGDIDVYVNNIFGDHRFRFGFDHEKLTSNEQSQRSGGVFYRYFTGVPDRFNPGGIFAADTEVARVGIRNTGGAFTTIHTAKYVQDRWSITDRLTVNIGLRSETFDNKNIAGETFVKIKNMIDYRLGFTFDPKGDRSSRFFGFYGTYHLPVANNTNVRMAGSETFQRDWFLLNGLNADDTPILGQFLGTDVVSPPGIQPKETLRDLGLTSQKMEEISGGYEFSALDNWKFGIKGIYKDLKSGIEDAAIDRGMQNFAADNGLDVAAMASHFSGFNQFILINPGTDATFFVVASNLAPDALAFLGGDPDGDGLVQVTLTKEQLGLPAIKRRYKALEFTFERAFEDGWSIQGSYLLSRSFGNYEGSVKSDIGQTDAGLTQDFDTRGLTDGITGRLPNDRKHTLKVFGSYQATDTISVGANATLQSPRHFGCLGVHPTDGIAALFGASSFYCKLDGVNSVFTPRGSQLKSEWTKRIDLSVNYLPEIEGIGALRPSFRVDVFNVFNSHDVTDRNEIGEFGNGARRDTYGDPTGFLPPRSIRFSARVEF
jgi:Carboxypeptidase regulatory-like domain/TonB-dependent Receptor Plug Domain